MKNLEIPLTFLLGVAIAGLATLYFSEASCQRTIKMHVQAELANAVDRASEAYRTKPLVVAQWELEQLSQLLQSGFISIYESADRVAFYEFLTSARLAKVCHDLGEDEAYQSHLDTALERVRPFHSEVTNAEALFGLLARKDEKPANQE